MQDYQEFTITAILFYAILIIINFSVLKHMQMHFEMNGDKFTQVGMMEYKNPTDGRTLYFLMYKKGDK